MKKVITYGTFDLLHEGHINILRRAKALGDYLIVGVTTPKWDRERGKTDVHDSLEERIAAVKATGFADLIITEDYAGQKVDDVVKYGVDIFVLGSDWTGKCDYLKEYCEVVYLPRTEGISSTMLRENQKKRSMQLVLLSGGSGKRLWPLSNNARSKQFLPLLEKEDGSMESMVQRVVRQITGSGLTGNITIATNASQTDIITNQLGGKVSVVTEPERRDTFPAIALAATYLSLKKGCPDDETVVIMPCDPYTEAGYFKTIGKMAEAVEADAAELVLMGIKPTYPSEKYGYVVPGSSQENAAKALKVNCFTEKPSAQKAEALIKEGALWNGGVFAFRLGYMMSIVRKYIQSDSFEDTRARYSEFPKISFDYEVAEKAGSVAVVPFDGQWKDLGTWNALTDELKRHTIGNAVLGPDCSGTHVINELQYPVFVNGTKDLIVAASPDGILVCSKKDSENLKQHVESLDRRPMYEERRWGSYRVLDDVIYKDGSHSLTKSITLKAGKNISYQIHHHRTESWTFVEGEGLFVLDGEIRKVTAGDTAVIQMGHFHAIKALTELTFIEVQIGNPLIEEDIDRFDYTWPSGPLF